MKLYTYCLRYDYGSAPNPYWGICTLVICKPVIRRTADIGDWVVGFCSASFENNKYPRHIVYAMKVTDKMTMKEYDEYCRKQHRKKIPDWGSGITADAWETASTTTPAAVMIPFYELGSTQKKTSDRDLAGKYALISRIFITLVTAQ
jgi:hypothetical protein